ncbi:MAG: sugar ABC transporter permease, partial [Chloroflexi bacterium]|nr:sugar ABC transporter permease [Chloroflexota bacterium]
MRLLTILDPLTRPILLMLVTAVDRLLTPIQLRFGIDKMGYFFILPNLLIFGIFVLLPMLLNFYYAMTGGTKLFPADRPFIGLGNFETLFDCGDFLSPNSCQEDLFWRGIFNTIQFGIFQVSGSVLFSLMTALVLNRKIVARGVFRSVFFYPVLLSP